MFSVSGKALLKPGTDTNDKTCTQATAGAGLDVPAH